MNLLEKLILALDFPSSKEALTWVDHTLSFVKTFKVGKELFTREGPAIVKAIQKKGGRVFLDLKFHDIPNTVAGASRVVDEMGVFMFNVHAMGGIEMMKAARAAVDQSSKKKGNSALVVAVTVLTSHSEKELREIGFQENPETLAVRYAQMAKKAGLDGVVCAVHEAVEIKKKCGKDFLVVTPGIRFESDRVPNDDQRRSATPEEAIRNGADFLVLGRSFFSAKDPIALLKSMVRPYDE